MGGVLIPLKSGSTYVNLGDSGFEEGANELRLFHRLIEQWPDWGIGPRILNAGHHGSRHSTGVLLLSTFRPTSVWVSSGWGNRYGHPHLEFLKRVGRFGAKMYRTDTQGCIKII
jgi:beta-lactamase superfamily II metal-dependent hydrolase